LTVVVDTSFVVELYDRGAPLWAEADRWAAVTDEELVTTPLAVAEMDHLVPRRGGATARRALWRNLEAGALTVRWWADAMDETLVVARKRPEIGLVDASLVALANRLRTDRVATLDDRFRSLKTRAGKPFVILPADARKDP
jgi:predicted nucleic acid-binding protein